MKKTKKNLFEPGTVEEVLSRINRLQPSSARQWGKMDPAQMMAHCSLAMNMALGELNMQRVFIGRLLGPFFKPLITNDVVPPRNGPSAPELLVSDERDFLGERELLKQKVQVFYKGGEAECTRHPHPFVGPLTPYAWSRGMYKHLDHHLRQFQV
jgi:Protein of unknown function (DUF1569)